MKRTNIPFSPPDITEEEISEVVKVLKSGWITTGPKTKEFERQIADYVGVKRAACLNSATASMELVLRIMGIGPGDEVITSAYTYTATAAVVEHVGAKLILIDTQPNSFEMDYDLLSKAINEKTKMIIPVDIAGKMCDYDTLFEIVEAKSHMFIANNSLQRVMNRIIVMADAAHSLGATYKGENSGQVADFTCFSFHAVKNLTTSEGGAAVWRNDRGFNDKELYNQFMFFSLHGQSKDALSKSQIGSWEYDVIYPAYKCNMTDISASIGIAQLKRYSDILDYRHQLIERYDSILCPNGIETLKHVEYSNQSSGHLFMTRIPGFSERERNEVIFKMAENGLSTNVHYKPLPMFTAYKNLGFDIVDFPNAYNQYKNEITLPLNSVLTLEEAEHLAKEFVSSVKLVRGFFDEYE